MPTVFDVKNVHCQNCAKRITSAVQSIHPASKVTVQIDTGRVTVEPPVADVAGVVGAIAEAGYEAQPAT